MTDDRTECATNACSSGEPLPDETVVCAAPDTVSCDLGDESVLLDLGASRYYGLNAVAARVWQWIQQPVRLGELAARLADHYEVSPAAARADLERLLRHLEARGLATIRPNGGT